MAVPPNSKTDPGLYKFIDDVVVPIPDALVGNALGIAALVSHARSRDTTPERMLEQGRQERSLLASNLTVCARPFSRFLTHSQLMLTASWGRVTPHGDLILFFVFRFLLTPLLTALAGHAKKELV